jgi:uncharacterized protein
MATNVAAPATMLYSWLLALLFVALPVQVILARRAAGLALGTAGPPALERAARVHGNAPIALLLLLATELAGAPAWVAHAGGATLVTGRVPPALGVSREPEDFRSRVAGMSLILTTIAALALLAIALAFRTA